MGIRSSMAIMLAATASLLGGCSSIFGGHHFTAQEQQWMQYASEPAGYAQAQMAQGRQALQDEQYGAAIIAFRNAQRFPECAAAAANGLGVAYAQIGRTDVAEHYFELAVSQAPEDRRFSANLDRLRYQLAATQTASAILTADASQGSANAVRAAFPGTALRAGIRVEEPQAKMARVSQTEVRLATADAGQPDLRRRAPVVSVVATSVDTAARRRNPNYPIRIELAPRAMADAGNRQNYPVRIAF